MGTNRIVFFFFFLHAIQNRKLDWPLKCILYKQHSIIHTHTHTFKCFIPYKALLCLATNLHTEGNNLKVSNLTWDSVGLQSMWTRPNHQLPDSQKQYKLYIYNYTYLHLSSIAGLHALIRLDQITLFCLPWEKMYLVILTSWFFVSLALVS